MCQDHPEAANSVQSQTATLVPSEREDLSVFEELVARMEAANAACENIYKIADDGSQCGELCLSKAFAELVVRVTLCAGLELA